MLEECLTLSPVAAWEIPRPFVTGRNGPGFLRDESHGLSLMINSLQLLRAGHVACCGEKESMVGSGGVSVRGRMHQGNGLAHVLKTEIDLPDVNTAGRPVIFVHEEEIKAEWEDKSQASMSYLGMGKYEQQEEHPCTEAVGGIVLYSLQPPFPLGMILIFFW